MRRILLALLASAMLCDASVPLLMFPVSLTSSFIRAAATDAAGNVYVTGTTYYDYFTSGGARNQFPATPGALQTVWGSKNCQPGLVQNFACLDGFVAKFSPTGQLIYATYLGGSGDDEGMAIAVDA